MAENKDLHFKGQQANEHMICFFRHHWISLFREFIYFFIFIVTIMTIILHVSDFKSLIHDSQEFKMLFLSAFLIGTIYLHRFFMKMLNHFFSVGIITDRRIIDHKKTLFFKDTMDAVDMAQIQNIESVGEGLLPNLLKYGDIKIYLSSSAAFRTLECIPNNKFHFRCITRQKEALQQQMNGRPHSDLHSSTPDQQKSIFTITPKG